MARGATGQPGQTEQLAAELVRELSAQGITLAGAESLTGGQVSAAITSIAGASDCFRGAIVSYATDLKAKLLGVDAELLRATGPVDAQVARQMARAVATMCEATIGLATTGVAGPESQHGIAVGTVFISVYDQRDDSDHEKALKLAGTRAQIQSQTVVEILSLTKLVVTGYQRMGITRRS